MSHKKVNSIRYKDMPIHITIEKIRRLKCKDILKEYEKQYDDFLEKNINLLCNENSIIEDYLEIRDELIMRINQIEREEHRKGKNNISLGFRI